MKILRYFVAIKQFM